MQLSFPQLLQLRNKLNSLTSDEKLTKIINEHNFVILSIADRKHILLLDIPELINLKNEVSLFFEDFSYVR